MRNMLAKLALLHLFSALQNKLAFGVDCLKIASLTKFHSYYALSIFFDQGFLGK